MSKRYSAKAVERVPAGGGYDEWFDVKSTAGLGDALDMSDYTTNKDRIGFLLSVMIVDWSLEGADGVKLPITADTITALDIDLVAPVVERMNALANSFLALASPTANQT